MKLQSLLLALAFTLTIPAARAQTGVYINPIAIHISNSTRDTSSFAFLGQNSTAQWFYGASIGGYYEVTHTPKLDLGLDVRDMIVNGNSAVLNSFLAGARIAGHPSKYGVRPYLEPVVGVGTSRSALNPLHYSKLQYGVFAGLDYPIHRHVDFRAIEVGYGSVLTVNGLNFQGVLYPSSQLITISSGLVFRFQTPAP